MSSTSDSASSKTLPWILAAALLALIGGGWWFFSRDGGDARLDADAASETGPRVPKSDGTHQPTPARQTRASGRIYVAEAGDGVEGAVVRLWPLDRGPGEDDDPIVAITDASGAWALGAVAAGRYRMSASASGFLPGERDAVELTAEAANDALDLALSPGGVTLSGRVRDVTGGQVEGAWVTVAPLTGVFGLATSQRTTTVSDADGKFSVQLEAGRYQVAAWHPDYTRSQRSVTMADQPRELELTLDPMASIEGRVLSAADGSPVPGAEVSYARVDAMALPNGSQRENVMPLGRVEADAKGAFRITGLSSGAVLLHAAAPALASELPTRVELAFAEQLSDVELALSPGHDLVGRVVDASDATRGIGGANIQLDGMGEVFRSAVADDEGRFRIEGLAAGRYRASARADGHLPNLEGQGVQVPSDSELELSLDAGQAIVGVVEPPQAAEVSLELDMDELGRSGIFAGAALALNGTTTTADAEGRFVLRPAAPGAWRVRAQTAEGMAGEVPVSVEAGRDAEVSVRLQEKARVSGLVVDAAGQPVADVSVQLRRSNRTRRMMVVVNGAEVGARTAPVGEDGSYLAAGMDAGDYELEVRDSLGEALPWADGTNTPLVLSLGEGERRENFELRIAARDGEIRGKVEYADGSPAADVWVYAVADAPEAPPPKAGEAPVSEARMEVVVDSGGPGSSRRGRPTLTDAEGNFALLRLHPGRYTVTAEGAKGTAPARERGVAVGARVNLELAALGGLRVELIDGGGGKQDAVLSLNGPSSRSSGFDGNRVELEGLVPGNYTVSVRTAKGGATQDVKIESGETARVEIPVERWAYVKGRVVDEQGAPLAGAKLLIAGAPADLVDAGQNAGEGQDEGEEGRREVGIMITDDGGSDDESTDADGRFEIAVGGGNRVLVVLDPKRSMPAIIRPFRVAGEDIDLGELRVSPDDPMAGMGGKGSISIDIEN